MSKPTRTRAARDGLAAVSQGLTQAAQRARAFGDRVAYLPLDELDAMRRNVDAARELLEQVDQLGHCPGCEADATDECGVGHLQRAKP